MRSLTIAVLVGQILVILFSWQTLPSELPLFYSRPWGKEQLATPWWLFLLPLLSLLVFLINLAFLYLLINKYFSEKEGKLISKIFEISSSIFAILCLITLIKIIFLVT